MALPFPPVPPIPVPVAVCASLWCIAAKYIPDLTDISLTVGIFVGLSVIALNMKKLFTKDKNVK